MTTTDEPQRHPAASVAREDGWPEGVYTVSVDGLDRLGVDKDGFLYWDGRLVKTARRITLDTQERVLAWIVAGSAVVAAGAAVVQAYAALVQPL